MHFFFVQVLSYFQNSLVYDECECILSAIQWFSRVGNWGYTAATCMYMNFNQEFNFISFVMLCSIFATALNSAVPITLCELYTFELWIFVGKFSFSYVVWFMHWFTYIQSLFIGPSFYLFCFWCACSVSLEYVVICWKPKNKCRCYQVSLSIEREQYLHTSTVQKERFLAVSGYPC